MDSNPMTQMMTPLYSTASFLVQANMSMDKGVEILRKRQVGSRAPPGATRRRRRRRGTRYGRFEDRENEHDDEEEGVGGQNRHLVDAFFGDFAHVDSV